MSSSKRPHSAIIGNNKTLNKTFGQTLNKKSNNNYD